MTVVVERKRRRKREKVTSPSLSAILSNIEPCGCTRCLWKQCAKETSVVGALSEAGVVAHYHLCWTHYQELGRQISKIRNARLGL